MLNVTLFGQFDLRLADEPVALSSRPAQALLAYLLLNRETVHRRGRVAGVLWPDVLESSARQSLRNALWQLRRAIGDEYLLADKTSLAFNTAAPYSLDVAILEDEPATNDPNTLIRVVSVYEGELLPDFYEDWVVLERERLRPLFERRIQALLDGLGTAGRWRDVQTWAERWIALGHVPEPAYRALMMAYAGLGDLAGVATSYRRCVQALENELGVHPSEDTQELYQRLTAEEAPLRHPPEPTRQQRSADNEERDPDDGTQSALPVQSTPFVGREAELAEIGRLLQREPTCRLLTLVGPGGIGKTRLALEAARAIRFAHGAWFVPLAPLGSSASLVSAIADGVRLRLHGSTDAREQLFVHLRDRELLLILDNFEHLLSSVRTDDEEDDRDGVVLVTELLERAPRLKLLVTSRERLNLSAEWVFNVEGLQSPDLFHGEADHDADAEADTFSAVQLFLQRARQVKRTFGQEANELACVARICRLVGGMPLAIELAAAWVNVLSCRDILQEIERNLNFLRTRLRDYPERHRDIRAVFDSSWNMLTEPERQLFRRLSVFRGGFTRTAAEAIGGDVSWSDDDLAPDEGGELQLAQRQPQVLAALSRLVDTSFVQHTSAGRYEIHELMRQYGAAKLLERPADERQARDNHARYYRTLLVHQEVAIRGAEQTHVLDMLAPEIENIKTAWNRAVARRRLDWVADMLPGWLWLFEIRNDFQEAAAAALHAVEAFRAQGAPAALTSSADRDNFAFLLSEAGWFAFRCRQTERGRALIDEALSVAGPESNPEVLWYAKANRGFIEVGISNLDEARRFTQQALDHARELGSPWHLAWPVAILGMICLEEGNPEDSYDLLQESLGLWQEVGDPRGLIFAYTHLGATTLALAKIEEALKYAEQCLALSRDVDDRWSQANALNLIGRAQAVQFKYEQADETFRESAALYREVGDLWGTAQALVNHGNALLDAGEDERAKAVFLEALPAAERARAVATGLSAIVGLARMDAEGDHSDRAYSLATYVAVHPQANESTRDAARQVCAAIDRSATVQVADEARDRFRGATFENVVRTILTES